MLIDETDFKKQLPVSMSLSFENVKPDLRRVELRHIKKVLGKPLYDSLSSSYADGGGSPSAQEIAILDYIQPAIANLGFMLYLDKGNVLVDDNGISSIHHEDKKPAFEWQVENLRKSTRKAGFDAIDDLISFLEENANSYATWESSVSRELFINSAIQFQEYVDIKESRGMLLTMLPIMRRIEKREIQGVLCAELYSEIKTQITADSISLMNSKLMDDIRGATAHMTWSKALKELAVIIDDDGIHLLNSSFSGTIRALREAETNRLDAIGREHLDIANGYLKSLNDYLQNNADDYPLFKSSSCFVDKSTDEVDEFVNDAYSGIVMI